MLRFVQERRKNTAAVSLKVYVGVVKRSRAFSGIALLLMTLSHPLYREACASLQLLLSPLRIFIKKSMNIKILRTNIMKMSDIINTSWRESE
jgi:hypothetical protein